MTCAQPEADLRNSGFSYPSNNSNPLIFFFSLSASPEDFYIVNEGTTDLTLTGGAGNLVQLTGSSAFSVTVQPASTTISPGDSVVFQIDFNHVPCVHVDSATVLVNIPNNDSDENPYQLLIMGVDNRTDTDSDGLADICDPDDDNDGVADGSDSSPLNFLLCGDTDGDGCDDCAVTVDGFGPLSDSDPANDGPDYDCDGICDTNDPPVTSVVGRGQMLSFDGTADFVNLGDVGSLNVNRTDHLTVEAWIQTSSGAPEMQIIGKFNNDLISPLGWGMQIRNGSLAFYLGTGTSANYFLSTPTGLPVVNDGSWHHIAVSYNGSSAATGCTFFIDGTSYAGTDALAAGTISGSSLNSESASIGVINAGTPSAHYDGKLDELRVWNVARTLNEIRENLHLSLSGNCLPSIVGYWKFNENTGSTTADNSQSGSVGTFGGAPTIEASEASVGFGRSVRQSVTSTATITNLVSYDGDDSFRAFFPTTVPNGDIVVTYIDELPVGGAPSGAHEEYRQCHWIVNNYGSVNTGLNSQLWFGVPADTFTNSTAFPFAWAGSFRLHKRGSRETGAWTQTHSAADAINPDSPHTYASFNGISSFSMFFMSSSAIDLPVELMSFDVQKSGKQAILTWVTASERNNVGFYIERSVDGLTWESIGFIQGVGNSTELSKYDFTDQNPLKGTSYYRLRQVDTDLAENYSDVKSVHFPLGDVLRVIPNPSHGTIRLSIDSKEVRITNAQGALVEYIPDYEAGDEIEIEVEEGLYFVHANGTTRKFVVLD